MNRCDFLCMFYFLYESGVIKAVTGPPFGGPCPNVVRDNILLTKYASTCLSSTASTINFVFTILLELLRGSQLNILCSSLLLSFDCRASLQ
jgi:hypothetical protein